MMELKRRILSVLVVLAFLTGMCVVAIQQEKQIEYEQSIPTVESRGVMSWLEQFSQHNFQLCDIMLENSNDGFYNARVVNYMNDERYYKKVLDSLVNCITDFQIQMIDKTNAGVSEYHVLVEFTPYKPVTKVVYELDMLDKAKQDFLDEKISEAEFQAELEKVYLTIFYDTCFQEDENAEPIQKVLILSEKEVNGVMCVYNTVSFVDSLLSDSNITKNISVYEKDVKSKVENLIKAE